MIKTGGCPAMKVALTGATGYFADQVYQAREQP
jgi:hypothetical protein